MQKIFPTPIPAEDTSLETIYNVPELAFPSAGVQMKMAGLKPERRPYIYFNMVSSVDGKITTQSGNAEGLGTRTDRKVMQKLRLASDAVLVGASTFRHDPINPDTKTEFKAERHKYFPNNPHPLALVLSSEGNLPLDNIFFQAERSRRVVFLGEKASPEVEKQLSEKAQVFRLSNDDSGRPDLQQLLRIAYDNLHVRHLLVEGGPTLNFELIEKGWADEFFWTLAPKIVGGEQNPTLVEGSDKGFELQDLKKLELISIYVQGSELFMRYKF